MGINSTTGVAGLTLGGGFGWLNRKYGMSVDNLVSADVVTTDGKLLHAAETDNPDLFWGIRGGGGNFGIVTNFEFQLHPVGPEVLSGVVVFTFDEAQTVLRKYGDFIHSMPDELNIWVGMRKAPPLPFLPESVHGKEVVILAVLYVGDPEEGKQVVEPVFSFGTPWASTLASSRMKPGSKPLILCLPQGPAISGRPTTSLGWTMTLSEQSSTRLEAAVSAQRSILRPHWRASKSDPR